MARQMMVREEMSRNAGMTQLPFAMYRENGRLANGTKDGLLSVIITLLGGRRPLAGRAAQSIGASGVEETLPLFFDRTRIGRRRRAGIGLGELAGYFLLGRLQCRDFRVGPALLGGIFDAQVHVRAGVAAITGLQRAILAAEEIVQHLVDRRQIAAVLCL